MLKKSNHLKLTRDFFDGDTPSSADPKSHPFFSLKKRLPKWSWLVRKNTYHPICTSLYLALFFLVIQQMIAASSTLWMARLFEGLQVGHFSFSLLMLYLASLCLPYLPEAGAIFLAAKARAKASVRFANSFTKVYKNRLIEWSNATQNSTKTSFLASEAPQALGEYQDFIYNIASSTFTVGLNIIVLTLVIEPLFLLSFFIGTALSFLILRLQKKRKRTLTLRAQQGRIKWVSMLLKAWDNVVLNNEYNFAIWKSRAQKRAHRMLQAVVKLEGFTQKISMGTACALFGPSILLILYLAIIYGDNLAKLSIVLISLPRLVQILAFAYEMLYLAADYPMHKGRLNTVLRVLKMIDFSSPEQDAHQLAQRIDWEHIFVKSAYQTLSPQELMTQLPRSGRFTLQGDNGTGKTSLLLLLKMIHGDSAFYLPAKHDLSFLLPSAHYSTGQTVRKRLQELFNKLDSPVVLLDEWDANLDQQNTQSLSQLIDQLSLEKCVIEARHIRHEFSQAKGPDPEPIVLSSPS